jgi:ATP-dependent Clp protease ATP-binding subunit ClpA
VGLTEQVRGEVKDIKQILAKSQQSATRSSDVVRQEMPLKPEVFHGRDGTVQEITQLLMKEETSRICILGPGGMGKTSISLAVVEQPLVEARFPPENRVWIPCIEATSATLLLEILYIQLQLLGDEQVTLEKIISELNTSTEPRLILLDNFETPCNAPGGTQN